jgi:hypothetical protein
MNHQRAKPIAPAKDTPPPFDSGESPVGPFQGIRVEASLGHLDERLIKVADRACHSVPYKEYLNSWPGPALPEYLMVYIINAR